MDAKNSNDNICVVCFRNITIHAVGSCDHYDRVCFICSARLRVLCQKNDCPICRKNLPKVIFSRQKQPYSVLSRQPYSFIDHKHNICFEDEDVEEEYRFLQQHQCPICTQVTVFQSFGHLKDHIRKIHERFYCELCVENLKLFTFERKYYNRKDLAQHRRSGDSDDTSHRGHPRCQFCDTRYIDKDELFRHLRRDHFYCHFCDSDGKYQFYGDYELLRNHFETDHYLCQEGTCIDEKFVSAFRSDMELKMHIAAQHSKNYPKQQAKQARTLELEFTITPRSHTDDFDDNRRGGRKGPRPGGGGTRGRFRYQDEANANQFHEAAEVEGDVSYDMDRNSAVDFPSLGNEASNSTCGPIRRPPPRNYREFNSTSEESFPPLGGGNGSSGNVVRLEIYNQDKNSIKNKGPNLSIKVSRHNPDNSKSAASIVAAAGSHPKPKPKIDISNHCSWSGNGFISGSNDFPTLQTQPTKKSTLSWTPKVAATSSKNVWLKSEAPKEDKKPDNEDFTLVVSKDKKKKQLKGLTNQNIKAKSPEKEIEKPKKKEPSPVNEIKPNLVVKEKPIEKRELTNKTSSNNIIKSNRTTPLGIEEFPPLMGGSTNSKSTVMPPGFATKKKQIQDPPPGFKQPTTNGTAKNNVVKNENFTLSSLARQLAVSTNISNGSSPEVSPITLQPLYFEPENFQSRNRSLIEDVMSILENDDTKFGEFKTYSGEFRKGLIQAREYYQNCVRIFGYENFCRVISELLVLLPDIPKQRELLNVYNEFNSTKNNGSGAVPKNKNFLVCATCQQVLSNFDFRTHMLSHEEVTFNP